MNNNLQYAIDNICEVLNEQTLNFIISGLPKAKNEDMCFDIQLILDISNAIDSWKERSDGIIEPWVISYFDGSNDTWTIVSKKMPKELAYREWFNLTNGGTKLHNSSEHCFYHLGKFGEKLIGRNSVEFEDQYESISYLISKSFG